MSVSHSSAANVCLDMAGLRRALHGWRFGTPLMEVASSMDLMAHTTTLVSQGAPPGSAFIQMHTHTGARHPSDPATPTLMLVLILPSEAATEALIPAATQDLTDLA
jgi:hypothetical protein